ncbi:MAG: hypothetical protein ABI068_02315 [Ktedonobacterales bacterium]
MRAASYVLVVLGIIAIVIALLNKYVLNHVLTKSAPGISDYYIAGAGLVIAVIGVAIMFLGGRKSA